MRRVGFLLASILLVVLAPTGASAQGMAQSFAELEERGVIEEGKDIIVTFRYEASAGYRELKGELISLDDSAIVVMVGKLPEGLTDLQITRREGRYGRYQIEIPEHRVQSVSLPPQGMSRGVGGLIGASIGIGATAIMAVACITANETGSGCNLGSPGALAVAAIGGGATVGVLLTGKSDPEVLYRSYTLPEPHSSSFRWKVSPVASGRDNGALLSIRW